MRPRRHAAGANRVARPNDVRKLAGQPAVAEPGLAEVLLQHLRRGRDRHPATNHHFLEPQLVRGLQVRVVVLVAVEELAAHLQADRALEGGHRIAAGALVDARPGLLGRVGQRHHPLRLGRHEALMMVALCDQIAVRVRNVRLRQHDRARPAREDVQHRRRRLQRLPHRRRPEEVPGLPQPEVAVVVLRVAQLREHVLPLAERHRGHGTVVRRGRQLEAGVIVADHLLVDGEVHRPNLLAGIGLTGPSRNGHQADPSIRGPGGQSLPSMTGRWCASAG